MRALGAAALFGFLILAAAPSCLEATAIKVVVSTDATDCAEMLPVRLDTGAPGFEAGETPNAFTDKCIDPAAKRIGTLVVTPSGRGDRVALRIEGGCNAGGCITAKRTLAFVSHRTVTLPVTLSSACRGVVCEEGFTCENGGCVRDDATCVDGICDVPDASAPPPDVDVPNHVLKVSVGGYATCALMSKGTVSCWGANLAGQLGNGTKGDDYVHYTPNNVPGITNAIDIECGPQHACATLSDGSLVCWGGNQYRQLGHDNSTDPTCPWFGSPILCNPTPTKVPLPGKVMRIGMGFTHTCALVSGAGGSGTSLYCWGGSEMGQLARQVLLTDASCTISSTSAYKCSHSPSQVMGLVDPDDVALGFAHTVVHVAAGKVFAFGSNDNGELGFALDALAHPTPKLVGVTGSLLRGSSYKTSCVLNPKGHVECWGNDDFSQASAMPSPDAAVAPITVPPIDTTVSAMQAAVGVFHVCALQTSGEVLCWGYNGNGSLGHNPATDVAGPGGLRQPNPTLVVGVNSAQSVSTGGFNTCILRNDNAVLCWGRNREGNCGHDPTGDPLDSINSPFSWTPTIVTGVGAH